jgi:hypothetical protein
MNAGTARERAPFSPAGRRFGTRVLREVMARLSEPSDAEITLYVADGADERVVQFLGKTVRVYASGGRSTSSLESDLLDRRVVSIETLHAVLEDARRSGRDLRRVLLERRVVAEHELAATLERLVREEVMSLVFWKDAQYAIYPGSSPPDLELDRRLPLSGDCDRQTLCEEVCEWTRVWDRLRPSLRSDRARLVLTARGEQVAGDPFARFHDLCVACREGVTLRDLARSRRRDLTEVCERVAELVAEGLVQAEEPASAAPLAVSQEIAKLEAALPSAIGKERALARLVELYLDAGLPEKAAGLLIESSGGNAILAPAIADSRRGSHAVSRLLTLAREYRAIRQKAKASGFLRLVLALDPGNEEARAFLEKSAPETGGTDLADVERGEEMRTVEHPRAARVPARTRRILALLALIGALGSAAGLLVATVARPARTEAAAGVEHPGTDAGSGASADTTERAEPRPRSPANDQVMPAVHRQEIDAPRVFVHGPASGWQVPLDAESVAVGRDRLAVLRDGRTTIFLLDGTPLASSELPQWTEGSFTAGALVLVRSRPGERDLAVWVADPDTLDIRWALRKEGGEIHWH